VTDLGSLPAPPPANQRAPVGYVGLVTRAVAAAIDAVVVNVIAVIVGAMVNLVASLFGHTGPLTAAEAIIGGIVWWLWVVTYFVSFWTLTGQTPGCRILGIRVENASGPKISSRQGLRRFVGVVLAALPLGAGFLLILVDNQRRGLQDRVGGTVVRWRTSEPPEPIPAEAPETAWASDPATPSASTPATASAPTRATASGPTPSSGRT
jgi:uncharacterized RDD family membrane protein YckC